MTEVSSHKKTKHHKQKRKQTHTWRSDLEASYHYQPWITNQRRRTIEGQHQWNRRRENTFFKIFHRLWPITASHKGVINSDFKCYKNKMKQGRKCFPLFVFSWVCVYVCVSLYMSVCTCHVFVNVLIRVCFYTYVFMCVCVYLYTGRHVCMYVCVHSAYSLGSLPNKRSPGPMIHTNSLSILCTLSLCAVPFIVVSMNAPKVSEEPSRCQTLRACACNNACVCVCVHAHVCFCDATTDTHTLTHTSPHLPQSMWFPYWFNSQTQDQFHSVFMSIAIWPGLWGLISSQFHPVGPFISRPELIHQRPVARQEKQCEKKVLNFFSFWCLKKKKKNSGRARER